MEHVRVAIIGAGFGGIGLAIRLRQEGIGPVLVLEKADGIGGTWRDNTYPGAACDVPSHLYSFSFERKPDWSRRFGEQTEILDYLRHCTEKYEIEPRLSTEVHEAVFQDGRWLLTTSTGTVLADVVVSATGQLNRPAVPDLPGLETFAGKAFHSARWDHAHDLTGRDVAVIGTGASAIQFVPHVAEQAGSLTVYQRSAPWVVAKSDRTYGRWEHRLFAAVPAVQDLNRALMYTLLESRALGFVSWPGLLKTMERGSLKRLREEIADPELRRKLTPDYPLGCKRVLISDEYYPAVRRPHVEVVTDAVKEVRPEGIVTGDGTLRRADTLIFGTGFRATEFLAPMRVTGRDGTTLDEAWRDGAEAHHGIAVHGFPNLYLLYGPNTNLGHSSIVYMIESQIAYILGCVRSGRVLEVRAEAQSRFAATMRERSKRSVWTAGCESWYLTDGRNTNNWPGYTFAYRRATRRPDPADFQVLPAPRAAAVPDPAVPGGAAAQDLG